MTCVTCGEPAAPAGNGWPLYYVGCLNCGPVTWGGRLMVMCGPACFSAWRVQNRAATWTTCRDRTCAAPG